MVMTKLERRFWAKVDRGDDESCWLWKANRNRSDSFGYGRISSEGKMLLAHRVSWFIATGEKPPDEICVLHRCDVPLCVNPRHLFLGTKLDNAQDRDAKGRTGRMSGSENPQAKTSANVVTSIRGLYAAGCGSLNFIARYFGMSKRSVLRMVQGKQWKNLPNPPGLGDRMRW